SRSTNTASTPARRHSTSQAIHSLSLVATSDSGTVNMGWFFSSRRRPKALERMTLLTWFHCATSIQTRADLRGKEKDLGAPTNDGLRFSRGFHGAAFDCSTSSANRRAMNAGASAFL